MSAPSLAFALLAVCCSTAQAQEHTSPALPPCSISAADTSGWNDVGSTVGSIRMKVPTDVKPDSVAGDSSTGLVIRHQTWVGQTSHLFVNVTWTRVPAIPGAQSVRIASPSQEVDLCRASIGQFETTIETRRILVPSRADRDSAAFYITRATFTLGPNEEVEVDGMTQTEADHQRLLAIIASVQIGNDSTVHH